MNGAAFFFVILAASMAAKYAALVAVDEGRFGGMPRPSPVD